MTLENLPSLLEYGYRRRKWINFFACFSLGVAAAVALGVLGIVFSFVVIKGYPAINWAFFTSLPAPVGEPGGGMANSLLGTVLLVAMASLVGIPWGIFTGVYLSEYARGRVGTIIRFAIDMLSSVPAIVIGVFVYTLVVRPMGRFSAIAGSLALAILMVPTVARNTEELLRMVPVHIREAGLALGLPRWKVILRIVIRGSISGITTGVVLAIARVAGETAPLLFTSLNNQYWQLRPDQPISSLPVQIYTYAIAPFEEWHQKAWAGALILVLFVFTINILTRLALRPVSARKK